MKKLLFVCFILLLSFGIFPGLVQAIEYEGLSIQPHQEDDEARDWFIYTLWPGESIEDRVDISNSSDAPIEVKIYPVDADILKDGAFAPKAEEAERVDIGAWITLADSEITLLPHDETRTSSFTLIIPKNTEAGKYTGAIVAQNKGYKQLETKEGTAMLVVTRVGARVYLTVRGTKVEFLEIGDINLGKELGMQAIIWNYEEEEISTKVTFDLLDDKGTLVESWVSSEEILEPENSRSVQFSKDTTEIGMGDYLVVGRAYRNGEEFKKAESQFRVGVAEFVVSNLVITPNTVLPGEEVTISIDVENTGNIESIYTATLKINDILEETKDVTLVAGETKTVTFAVSRAEEGTYNVAVDGLTDTFSVKIPLPWTTILIGVLIVIVILVIVIAIIVVLRMRRKLPK
ncbi:MAG: WxL protein peptidoglycan domain-containing protein [Candidatus Humimicrobiaceae bacterium]